MSGLPAPLPLVVTLVVLALLPFLAVMISSYVKISVVILLLRNALGLPQVPPAIAVNALAIILSVYLMTPVGYQVYRQLDAAGVEGVDYGDLRSPATQSALLASVAPVQTFLASHADPAEREFFAATARRIWPPELAAEVDRDHLLVLLPAFATSELSAAFEIGFLLYLPFVVIDLIVSNVLLAMGMMMVSPLTISLPFKLLLFVSIDGWTRLIHGLVLSYQG